MSDTSSHTLRFSRSSRLVCWPIGLAFVVFLESSRSKLAIPDTGIPSVDKVGHFHVYGLLATLVLRVFFSPTRRWRGALIAVVCASIYGVTDEFHQIFTPGRGVEFLDWLADTGGAILAVTLYSMWPHYRRVLEFPLWRRPPTTSSIAPPASSHDASVSAR